MPHSDTTASARRLAGFHAAIREVPDVQIFHAGTHARDGKILSNGGRVLNITATGSTITQAVSRAYSAVDKLDWPGGFCRRDIAWRALERERQSG